jgi:haloalkane dehalogenase
MYLTVHSLLGQRRRRPLKRLQRGAQLQILRTPDERFVDLPGYSFSPHYVDVDAGGVALRMHYIDEGPKAAPVVLLLHGEPSWSYLYRHMIPVFTASGLRAVAIDLVGFGRSDKPADRTDYTYQAHVDWLRGAIDAIGLRDITLVCQDWGGLIGLRLVAEDHERFARVVAANTFLPTGDVHPGKAFLTWQRYSQDTPQFTAGQIVNGGCTRALSTDVIKATTPHFRTTASRQALGNSRCWFPPHPTIRPPRPTERRGRPFPTITAPSSAHSLIQIPSPAELTQSWQPTYPVPVTTRR